MVIPVDTTFGGSLVIGSIPRYATVTMNRTMIKTILSSILYIMGRSTRLQYSPKLLTFLICYELDNNEGKD